MLLNRCFFDIQAAKKNDGQLKTIIRYVLMEVVII